MHAGGTRVGLELQGLLARPTHLESHAVTEMLLGVPVVVRVLVALGVILLLNRLSGRLLLSVVVAAVVLALWSGHSPAAAGRIAWERLSSAGNLFLLLVVFQVIWLSSQMSETGVMRDLVLAVRARVSRRRAMAVLPALIGLLPMPGGALFSAPLVDSCDGGGHIASPLKAQTNHWFRHVWEYWWPLYPGILLAMQITGLDLWQFMILGIPLTLTSMAAGYVFLLRRIHPEEQASAPSTASRDAPGLLPLVLPIIVVIAGYAAVRISYSALRASHADIWRMNRYVPMAIGLLGAMLVLQLQRPLKARAWWKIILSSRAINMAAIVAAVRVYGAFIEARLPDGMLLVEQMRNEVANLGVPVLAVMMLVPMVSGLATGLAIGFVGASLPIVVNLLGEDPSLGTIMSATALAYGFGYVGMLLSPVHICLIVTSEYFETGVMANILSLARPAVAILLAAAALYLALGALIP